MSPAAFLTLALVTAGAVVAQTPLGWKRQQPRSVTITNGTLIGVEDTVNNVQRFLGVPYAQPPIGDLRLRPAKPLDIPFDTLEADTYGPSCTSSEDCLTLNIWQPRNVSSSSSTDDDDVPLLPVMLWLYGGGLTGGSSSDPLFEGTNLVRISQEIGKPVILVSANYRLGPLGFLNGRQMAELKLLNLGMRDQRLAMHWLQDNIAAFGGDPARVTLFGESAGAVSIYSHMMAYGGRDDGLFRGAILQSGGAFPLTHPNTTSFQASFDSLITGTNCSVLVEASAEKQLDCIRSLPITVFRSAVGRSTGQSIDGDFTRTSVQLALPAGEYVRVPVIVGSNTDEGTTSAPTGINTKEELAKPLAAGFFRPIPLPDSMVSDLLSIYPTDPQLGCPYNTGKVSLTGGSLDKQACSIFGDLVQVAPARMIARTLAADDVPVYRYRFNALPHDTKSNAIQRGIGTGIEQAYVFSNEVADHPWDQALAYEVTSAWVSFATDLDPNAGLDSALPVWPEYGSEANSMVFGAYSSSIESDTYRREGIDYIISNVLPYGAA